ncbi:MAG: GlxA family transcriptional regulator [Arenicella sp.]|nr:GlxA family transcriptional regulator [Arenicella sp.]
MNTDKPVRYGFLLLPNYSMLAYSSAVEVLRMANRLRRETLYEWPTYTLDGQAVAASNGMTILPDHAISEMQDLHVLFVCSGVRVMQQWQPAIKTHLVRAAKSKVILGGICTGTQVLATAGLLEGYRCTIHWENLASLRETSPNIIVSEELYELDRDRYTVSGGTAPLDMMYELVKREHGKELAVSISEQFMCDRMRGEYDRQRVPLKLLIGADQPKLIEAVELMESNLEELINLDDLSSLVGVSRRQLERLFKKYLGCVPSRYYLDLRLKKARQLLLQTSISISDVAIACGFVSASHFSKSYRDMFGRTPREERQQQRLQL